MGRRHILTGAGFTHNFGGPLAAEVSALILNAIDGAKEPALKDLLRRNFDFETVHHQHSRTGGGRSTQAAYFT